MQCLYCQKRLGMFASKKSPFCSKLHEDWYHDEQAGSAIRRLLEPFPEAPAEPARPPEVAAVPAIPEPVHLAAKTLLLEARKTSPEPHAKPTQEEVVAIPPPGSALEPAPLQPLFILLPEVATPPPPVSADAWAEIGITRAAVLLRKLDLPAMPTSLPPLEEELADLADRVSPAEIPPPPPQSGPFLVARIAPSPVDAVAAPKIPAVELPIVEAPLKPQRPRSPDPAPHPDPAVFKALFLLRPPASASVFSLRLPPATPKPIASAFLVRLPLRADRVPARQESASGPAVALARPVSISVRPRPAVEVALEPAGLAIPRVPDGPRAPAPHQATAKPVPVSGLLALEVAPSGSHGALETAPEPALVETSAAPVRYPLLSSVAKPNAFLLGPMKVAGSNGFMARTSLSPEFRLPAQALEMGSGAILPDGPDGARRTLDVSGALTLEWPAREASASRATATPVDAAQPAETYASIPYPVFRGARRGQHSASPAALLQNEPKPAVAITLAEAPVEQTAGDPRLPGVAAGFPRAVALGVSPATGLCNPPVQASIVPLASEPGEVTYPSPTSASDDQGSLLFRSPAASVPLSPGITVRWWPRRPLLRSTHPEGARDLKPAATLSPDPAVHAPKPAGTAPASMQWEPSPPAFQPASFRNFAERLRPHSHLEAGEALPRPARGQIGVSGGILIWTSTRAPQYVLPQGFVQLPQIRRAVPDCGLWRLLQPRVTSVGPPRTGH